MQQYYSEKQLKGQFQEQFRHFPQYSKTIQKSFVKVKKACVSIWIQP